MKIATLYDYYINSQVVFERNSFNYGKYIFRHVITRCVHVATDRFTRIKSAYAKVIIKPNSLLKVTSFYHVTEDITSMTHQ